MRFSIKKKAKYNAGYMRYVYLKTTDQFIPTQRKTFKSLYKFINTDQSSYLNFENETIFITMNFRNIINKI